VHRTRVGPLMLYAKQALLMALISVAVQLDSRDIIVMKTSTSAKKVLLVSMVEFVLTPRVHTSVIVRRDLKAVGVKST